MIHTFASPNRPNTNYAPSYPSPSPALIIQQLRRQNQMLKQQISIMKIQMQSPSPRINNQLILSPRNAVQNSEQDAEVTYRNKMSKLKTKKTRLSQQRSITTPSSLNTSIINSIPFPPSLANQRPKSPICKMVLVKDNSGKFYRQRSQEQSMNTERKNNPSQSLKRPQIPFLKYKENTETAKVFKPNGHKRGETRDLGVTQTEKTKRNNTEVTHIPPFLNSHRLGNNRAESKPIDKNQIPYGKEQVVPRGNIYIEKGEQAQKGKMPTQSSWQQNNSLGESKLSIQLGLNPVKSARRLNYDIYLNDQN